MFTTTKRLFVSAASSAPKSASGISEVPAVSKAQQKALFAKAAKGEVPQKVAEEFAVSGKAYKKLPEHVSKKRKR